MTTTTRNRVVDHAAMLRERIAGLTDAARDKLDADMAVDFAEHFAYQETQARAHAAGVDWGDSLVDSDSQPDESEAYINLACTAVDGADVVGLVDEAFRRALGIDTGNVLVEGHILLALVEAADYALSNDTDYISEEAKQQWTAAVREATREVQS